MVAYPVTVFDISGVEPFGSMTNDRERERKRQIILM
jgi:hypothetical protein